VVLCAICVLPTVVSSECVNAVEARLISRLVNRAAGWARILDKVSSFKFTFTFALALALAVALAFAFAFVLVLLLLLLLSLSSS
jgi:hypothetical protein